MRNRKGKSETSSQFKGVRLYYGKWRGEIMGGDAQIYLGQYDSEEYAAKVYDAAAWIIFGAAAHYNFPIGSPDEGHRIFASARIEKHTNKQRGKPMDKEDRTDLGLYD